MFDKMVGISLLGLLVVLLFFQGGFFPGAVVYVLVGFVPVACVLFCLAFRLNRNEAEEKSERVSGTINITAASVVPPLLFAIIAGSYALSVFVHGLPLGGLIDCASWLLAALAAFSASFLGRSGTEWFLRGLAWFGVISACIGIVIASGFVFVGGTMQAGRLQFFFQYANAAGAWFACASLLCFCSKDVRLVKSAAFPLTALLLTQSMGCVVLLACVLFIYVMARIMQAHRGDDETRLVRCCADIVSFSVQGSISAIAALCCMYVFQDAPGAGLVSLFVMYAASSLLWSCLVSCFTSLVRARTIAFIAIAACIVMALVLSFSMVDRILQASGTFAERMVQASDAARLLSENLLLGIGPDQWRFVYPLLRSADYQAMVVHCGYLQMALDGGIAAPLILLGLLVFGGAAALRHGQSRIWLLLLFLGLHSFFDFDLRFAFFAVLIGILVALTTNGETGMPHPGVIQ